MVYDIDFLLVYIFSHFGILVLFVRLVGFYSLGSMHYTLELTVFFITFCVYGQHIFFRTLTQTAHSLNVVALFHTLQIGLRKSRNEGQSVLQVGAGK